MAFWCIMLNHVIPPLLPVEAIFKSCNMWIECVFCLGTNIALYKYRAAIYTQAKQRLNDIYIFLIYYDYDKYVTTIGHMGNPYQMHYQFVNPLSVRDMIIWWQCKHATERVLCK